MDNPERESKTLVGIAANLLKSGDFTRCRKFALLARGRGASNPTLDRILLVRARFESLSALLEPEHNSFPIADVALCLVNPGEATRPGKEAGQETFWTVCPYCYGMFMYEKVYEECCLRCQVCRKAFHGVAIRPPAPEMLVEGKEEYYFTYGCFRIEYGNEAKKKKSEECVCVVEISDDDEGEEKEEVKDNAGVSGGGEVAAEERKTTRVRSSKKRMGDVVKEVDDELDGDEYGLEFYESGDDVLVGIGSNYK